MRNKNPKHINVLAYHLTRHAENRLISVDGGATATYLYDAEGRRIHRSGYTSDTCDSTGKRDYVYDLSGHAFVENNFSGGTGCKTEVYAGGRHLAKQGGDTIFDHSDWLGTERLLMDYVLYNGGHVSETCTSLPFGDALTCSSNWDTLHFTGKERDSESGLDNFGARYNSSNFGRFISPDEPDADQEPRDPQSWNLYTYVRNNPLNNTDPTGNACVSSDGGKTFHNDDSGGQSCADAAEADKKTNPQAVVTAADEPIPWYFNLMCAPVGCKTLMPLNKPLSDALKNMKPEDLALMAATEVPFPEGELGSLLRPAWAETSGGFVNWLKNLQRSGTKLTKEQADAIIAEAKKLLVDVRLDPPHGPGNPWNVEHLNVGRNGQAHLEVPAGYENASVAKGSVRKP